jgi:hypothetical protein
VAWARLPEIEASICKDAIFRRRITALGQLFSLFVSDFTPSTLALIWGDGENQ